MRNSSPAKTLQITVTGLVQGVGFRPFVYRMAVLHQLTGWVQNTNENVRIEVSGNSQNLSAFLTVLKEQAPLASVVEAIKVMETEAVSYQEFSIRSSFDGSEEVTEISPDIAVCEACLLDTEQFGRRKDYSFVNCTHCGPRFTIVEDLPYDRAKTTMKHFEMCPDCRKEYETISDRRFHAQPTACSKCGPHYQLFRGQEIISEKIGEILGNVATCIGDGGLILMKGLGGMHLACDAFNESAIQRLRELKNREGKPFAVLFRDLECLREYAVVGAVEEQSLLSWQRPIVLLEMKGKPEEKGLPTGLNAGLNLLGVMLPYLPFHYQLFAQLQTEAIVLTSGNFSREPILTENAEALTQFSERVDLVLLHNRAIFNRTDDSVVRIMDHKERILRRSRGYAPAPVRTALNTEGIVAFGAELTNCFCVGKGRKAFLSQHIGDLQGLETLQFYEETVAKFIGLFRIKPTLLAVDSHPAYLSTKTGLEFGEQPVVQVQHHHAHIASCMAEHKLDETVIGVAMDGTGYGDDGHTWGSEFLVCDLNQFKRISHFGYLPMPGGDSASEEPWRMAVSWLYQVYGAGFAELKLPFLKHLDPEKIRMIVRMIEQKINCPLTSGAGRYFDAVAALLDLVQTASFQAEGPMRLESMVRSDCMELYPVTIGQPISFEATLRAIVGDIVAGEDSANISTKFHNTIILAIFESVNAIRTYEGIHKVVLSGGVFQNRYLLEGTTKLLKENDFEVFSHATIPTNDGGIALGQLAIASKRRELKCV